MNDGINTNETRADILREMRGNEFDDPHLDRDGMIGARRLARDWADRIEAAAKREMDVLIYSFDPTKADRSRAPDPCAYALEAMEPPCVATTGNASAMREALDGLLAAIRDYHENAAQYVGRQMLEVLAGPLNAASAALAAPSRNCDVYRTVEEAFSACHADRGYISDPVAERRSTISFMLSAAQETAKNEQCAPPIAKETAKIEQPGNVIAKNPPNFYQPGNAAPPPTLKISLDAYAYPDSGKVNGVYDPEEPTPDNPVRRPFLIPSERFKGEWRWRPVIDVETGTIDGWPQGTVASIYDKPCDDCAVIVDGRDLNEGEYVPRFLSPGDPDHDEDYLFMDIGADGRISGWNAEEAKAWIAKRKKEVTAP